MIDLMRFAGKPLGDRLTSMGIDLSQPFDFDAYRASHPRPTFPQRPNPMPNPNRPDRSGGIDMRPDTGIGSVAQSLAERRMPGNFKRGPVL